jgi:DNA-binding NarL/FixJ family response regulator
MFNLIRPHFNQAQRNAELATQRLRARTKPLAAYNLTPRETEVAGWLSQGKTNPEIAIILQTRPRTIEKHMEKILEKLGVENRTAAAMMIAGAEVALS